MAKGNFFAQLPRGKEDKPLLFSMGELTYDFHDIDGLYFMLDRRLSGCLILMWAKPMNPDVTGTVTLNGTEIEKCVLTSIMQMGDGWILGVPLRGLVTEYGKEYALHVEGFVDTDGNVMNPQDFKVKSMDRVLPDEKDAAREAIALQAATEGIVLLKNKENLLPLKEGTALNLFGKGIHQFRNGAVGAGKITPRYSVDFKEAVRESGFSLNEELIEFYSCDEDEIPPEELLTSAKMKSDIAVMMITRAAGENMDLSSAKGEYYLSEKEEVLLEKLTGLFAHTIVILNVGYPIDVTFAEKYGVDALLYTGYGGMLGGPAIVNILSGADNPSGKLTDTWAKDYFDIPASRNFYDCVDKPRLDAECEEYIDTYYEEDIYVGYRYFTTFKKEAAYPFGYGLSYTEFVIEPQKLIYTNDKLTIKVQVKNIGDCAGKEVVQVYVGKPEHHLEKPEKELAAFEKTNELQPGEMQELLIEIPKHHLTSYSEKQAAYLMESGTYRVYVGNSIEAPFSGTFELKQEDIVKQVTNLMVPQVDINVLSKQAEKETYPTGEQSGVCEGKTTFEPYAKRKFYQAEFEAEKPEKEITFDDVRNDLSKADMYTAQLSLEELARVSVCASAGWGMEGIGEAGRIYKLEGGDLPDFPVSDGNSGVNLRIPNIGMPSGVTICSSFNKELSAAVGRVIGEEAKLLEMPMILAPALNIHRNPLNGRHPEYFSEDPYLAGTMAGWYANGLEGAGTGACIKHLVANNCETSRKRNQSVMTERALREIYFKAFEIAMEVHMPASVMTAYNACNGQPTATDPELLQGLLREENGFDGFVMTDWTSYDTADVAAMIEAGNSWITPGSTDDTYTSQIVAGVNEGRIQMARLQKNVSYLIRTLARFA
ncbi:MAG: glycoside hydrolase family 3 C-terminal domain-containing protein [Lachnospiraceae bacterium]